MKQFLKNIIIYGTILTTSFTGLLFLSNSICRYFFKIKIPPQKNVLVVGTSHPESAINDNLIPRTKNMAQSGTCYFYTYIKSREIINHNPHIDTLVLGYSYGDISFGRNLWFFGEKNIQSKMRNYFFMFDLDDYLALLKGNPKAVIVNTPRAIINNLKLSFTGLKSLGGYKKLKKDNLKKDIIDHENHKDFYKKK